MCKEKEMTLISFPNSVVNISLLNNSKAFVSSSHLIDGKIAILLIYLAQKSMSLYFGRTDYKDYQGIKMGIL